MAGGVRELDDIQALVKTGYGDFPEACYLLLTVKRAAEALAWLKAFRPTTVADTANRLTSARHLAISAPGLSALGVPPSILSTFAPEFTAGMAADSARSRRLGDVGKNAPDLWAWGAKGQEPHAVLMLFAVPGGLAALKAEVTGGAFGAAFEAIELTTAQTDRTEPFGFADGISQPTVDMAGERTPGGLDDLAYGNLIAAGEFLLGYPNEYGLITRSPQLAASADPGGLLPRAAGEWADLGRNGSYLVFRQLAQDVKGFWAFVEANGGQPLAEAMVGRRKDGTPLVPTGERPIRGVADGDVAANGFDFEGDTQGLACPYTGHVRRANPRTGDMPGGARPLISKLAGMLGFGVDRRADIIASSRFHRLLRRGRKYAEGGEVGLHFICLSGNIGRQFEFVQGAWLASAKFAGLTGEQDPLLGARQPFPADQPTDAFRWPQAAGPCREYDGLPQFITVKGGAYFFLPGVRALRFIASA
jgi:deferrochelatase/peroxidase EfeB